MDNNNHHHHHHHQDYTLPATTYSPPRLAQHLSVSTSFAPSNDFPDDSSPDPRDFYLQYHDPFGGDGPSPDLKHAHAYSRRPIPNANNPNPSTSRLSTSPTSSRLRQSRSSSGTTLQLPKANNPAHPSRPNNNQRQSSLRDLVDKFNQNLDEVPPRPQASLSSSRAPSPSPVATAASSFQSNPSSFGHRERDRRERERQRDRQRSPQSTKHRPPRQNNSSSAWTEQIPTPSRPQQPSRRPLFGEITPLDSQLGYHAHGISSPRRRRGSDGSMHRPNPMFADLSFNDPDSGLSPSSPTAWYRGYTPTSGPDTNITTNTGLQPIVHRRSRSDLTDKPSSASPITSPSDSLQNMGITPAPNPSPISPVNTIKTRPKSNSQSRIPVPARRFSNTSDSGNSSPSTRANSALDRYAIHIPLPPKGASALPKPSAKSPTSPSTTKSLKVTSPTSPSTVKSFRLTSPTSPSASRKNSTTNNNFPITSPGRRGQLHISSPDTPKSPSSLKAYISAPPPKKSPPLRSSRPRQPVSQASTSASRARVSDRISDLQSQSSTSTPASGSNTKDAAESRSRPPNRQKSRRLPELGNVDFAARRQRIQQAFNKTVKENAEKEEVRRKKSVAVAVAQRNRAVEAKQEESAREDGGRVNDEGVSESRGDASPVVVESEGGGEQETFVTPEEGRSPDMRHLAESSPPEEEKGKPRQTSMGQHNDGETSGAQRKPSQHLIVPDQKSQPPTSDDPDPASAVTVDTDVTTLDPEPQSGHPQPSYSHRTVLSQIMQMRESSPDVTDSEEGEDDDDDEDGEGTSSEQDEDERDGGQELDDGESIQIMLRQSRYFHESVGNSSDNNQEREREHKHGAPPIDPDSRSRSGDDRDHDHDRNRWSTSSFDSSVHDQRTPDGDADAPLESIDESPLLPVDSVPKVVDENENENEPLSGSTDESGKTAQPHIWPSLKPPPLNLKDENQRDRRPQSAQGVADSPRTRTKTDTLDATARSSTSSVPFGRYSTHMMQQYPDLAKQGGWDSKRVTQLYLLKLAEGGFNKKYLLRDDSNVSAEAASTTRETEIEKVERTEPKIEENANADTGSNADGLSEDPVIVPASREVPRSEYIQHRASLNLRDDWVNTSPSVTDWMHFAAAHGDPSSELPEVVVNDNNDHVDGAETPRNVVSDQHQSVDGLGLSIRIQSPEEDSPTLPPPLPTYAPPPPPGPPGGVSVVDRAETQPSAPQISPSIYSSHPPSSVFPATQFVPGTADHHDYSIRSSDDSSLRRSGPSPHTLASSATSQSQDRSSAEQSSFEAHVPASAPAQKPSPSPDQRRLKKRKHVIKELIDTEHAFGRDMTVVVDIYKGTSSSCLDLSGEDVKTLFGNSDQVVKFSMAFQDALKHAAKTVYVLPRSQRYQSKRGHRSNAGMSMSSSLSSLHGEVSDEEKDRRTNIGQAFMTYIAQMEKVYSEYLKNHDAANRTLETLMRKKNVSIWLKECRDWAADLTSAWNLDSLLVKPVQRIVKYPLLLTELLSATPTDHPDHAALADALRETTSISVRINDMKKRADVVGQVVGNRKRKESDVRAGLSKAFGRRTEKLKQQVGLTEMFADKEFDALAQRFSDNFFQLQLVMRDVELYETEVQAGMKRFSEFVGAVEAYVTVAPSNYPELESKWCRFRLAVKDVMAVALVDHVAAVRKHVILPMVTLLKLHDGPQRVMQKRNKRLMDYVRYKTTKERGDKPDKKTTEQGEQFIALNITLKEELPKLFKLTGKLMEACLNSFVQLQTTWLTMMQKRLGYTIERQPERLSQLIRDWSGDFSFSEAQVLSLGICNGSIIADAANIAGFGSPNAPNGVEATSSRRPSTVNSATNTNRTFSLEINNNNSPKVSHDFGITASSNNFASSPPPVDQFTHHANGSHGSHGSHVFAASNRVRTNSSFSAHRSGTPELQASTPPTATTSASASAQILPSMSSIMSSSARPSTDSVATSSSLRPPDVSPSLPQLSLDTPTLQEFLADPVMAIGNQNRGRAPPDPADHPASPTSGTRYTGIFSSAMPMPESPDATTPVAAELEARNDNNNNNHHHRNRTGLNNNNNNERKPNVLFLAASMFEFNIDRSRREAGYPYLTYVAGEVFDVLGEKGELWLAKNQDDPTGLVGWIWTKHFTKLAI